MDEIMKLTGHKSLETLVKSYNFSLDDSNRLDMSAAIGFGPQLSRGEIKETSGIYLKTSFYTYPFRKLG